MRTKPIISTRLILIGIAVLVISGLIATNTSNAATYDEIILRDLLDQPVKTDMYLILTKHLIAAKLNILAYPELSFFNFPDGSYIDEVIAEAEPYVDDYLSGAIFDPEIDRAIVESLKDKLDTFNNGACSGTDCACTPGYWKQDKHIWPQPYLDFNGDGGEDPGGC
jgi:hypothetical protein